jgi:hypothetical protein
MAATYCICDDCQELENQEMCSFQEIRQAFKLKAPLKEVTESEMAIVKKQIKEDIKNLIESDSKAKHAIKKTLELDDPINRPSHYNQSRFQPADVIDAWELSYSLGNVVKYICRHRHKNQPLEDLKKARWYLDREIKKLEE